MTGLEYEAYEPMARSEFSRLCADVRQRWPTVAHICVHHRLGSVRAQRPAMAAPALTPVSLILSAYRWVEVGQASVVMAISSPHRHEGQQAIQHCLTQLKAKIPIWKKVRTPGKNNPPPRLSSFNMSPLMRRQEVYDSQDGSWKQNPECPWAADSKRPQETSSTENPGK